MAQDIGTRCPCSPIVCINKSCTTEFKQIGLSMSGKLYSATITSHILFATVNQNCGNIAQPSAKFHIL